ncbi:MAG: peptide MFS transporter [Burkholderiales bacterium]|nr:peptide MFS transporter [Burkholderiales bacterium]
MSAKAPAGTFLGHPTGLFLLFATEMWERFSYYGMRALLVLSLVAGTSAVNPGFGWSKASALQLYGIYTALVYFTPVAGGWLADNFIGQRRSVIIGGIIMAAGQFTLASAIPGNITLFFVGLALLVIGNGFFKPNISTMVGDLYAEGDVRRDGAFTIFYMGINTGAFFAPLVCSTLGENAAWGWRFGYIAAGCGMLLSVVIQVILAKRFLGEIGMKPGARQAKEAAGGAHAPLTSEERDRLRVIFMLFVFVMLFWTAFEQAGGLMNLYAAEKTNRFLSATYEVPAGYFQSLNPMFIVLLGPVFAAVWLWLGTHGKNPATPVKMIFGLLLTALGFVFMIGAVFDQQAHGKASMMWLVLAYLFHTMGELCISPVGLSMVTKLSPPRLASLMMGIWFLINFFANYLAGLIGSFAEKLGELNIFGGITIVLAVFAVGLWTISGKLVDWMHGAETVKALEPAPQLTEHTA